MTKETSSPKINEIWSKPKQDEINDIVYIFDEVTLSPDFEEIEFEPDR